MSDNEKGSSDSASHWETVPLGKVINKSTEKVDPDSVTSLPYLGLKHIQKGTGKLEGKGNPDEVSSTKALFREEDVLYGKLRPYLNKVWVSSFKGICSTDILVLRANDNLLSRFLYYRLLSSDFVAYADQNSTGVNHPRVSFGKISKFEIGLPPLPEQRRIVAKIEELFSNLDAGMGELSVAEQQLERYRLSVLQAAVEGRLTADWRRTHTPEPADQLLDRILEERRTQWEKDYRAKYAAKGKDMPRYWKKRYNPPKEPDLPDDLPSLPKNWLWTSLGYICDMTSGGTPKRSNEAYWNGSIPWLKSGELNDGIVKEAEEKITNTGFQESSTTLFPKGTLLIALYGATTGKLGILDFESATNQAVCGLLNTESLHTKYLFWYLRQFRSELLSKRFGGAQKNISQTILKTVPVALPPLAEQKQIVAEVERLLSVADDASATTKQEQTRAERLRQSILKQAFSGNLVPHEAQHSTPEASPEPAVREGGQIEMGI